MILMSKGELLIKLHNKLFYVSNIIKFQVKKLTLTANF